MNTKSSDYSIEGARRMNELHSGPYKGWRPRRLLLKSGVALAVLHFTLHELPLIAYFLYNLIN